MHYLCVQQIDLSNSEGWCPVFGLLNPDSFDLAVEDEVLDAHGFVVPPEVWLPGVLASEAVGCSMQQRTARTQVLQHLCSSYGRRGGAAGCRSTSLPACTHGNCSVLLCRAGDVNQCFLCTQCTRARNDSGWDPDTL